MTSTNILRNLVSDATASNGTNVAMVKKDYRPLTEAQERLILSYAMYAQGCDRMELAWDGDMICVRLLSIDDRKRMR